MLWDRELTSGCFHSFSTYKNYTKLMWVIVKNFEKDSLNRASIVFWGTWLEFIFTPQRYH